ncbi:Hypothetical predicted protein [Pelobates cultripes]|uniref:Uncharacterized protein n=1 Tax=Pelobates cultripes TaxID=61616 RepID=A0AAD1RZB9_PELCU|nr:Hypothetical predicted protein [Pelobates cultripes]
MDYNDHSDDLYDPGSDAYDEETDPSQDTLPSKPSKVMTDNGASGDTDSILDPQGEPLFDPDDLHRPQSADWSPSDHMARYVSRLCKPLDKATKNKLRAECPYPTCKMLSVGPQIVQNCPISGKMHQPSSDNVAALGCSWHTRCSFSVRSTWAADHRVRMPLAATSIMPSLLTATSYAHTLLAVSPPFLFP